MIIVPTSDRPIALADWVEASLLTRPNEAYRVADTTILKHLEDAELDDPDALLSNIQQTISTRSRVVGSGYPIRRDGLGFSSGEKWSNFLPYSFMLMASLNQIYSELRYSKGTATAPAEYFEILTAKALERYLDCSVIRIGAPRRKPVPAAFPAALEYSVEQLKEALGQRDLEYHNSGDDGVDLIGWRNFGDSRESQAIVLAQCAIGTDWKDKRDGISLETWKRHIDWHSRPLTGFAVPFHHEAGRSWRETATRGGIIFDRLRIAKLTHKADLEAPLKSNIEKWCRKQIGAISRLEIEERWHA